jgi:FtsP/CotA-like multicopper oxidase with cupredoxin domain
MRRDDEREAGRSVLCGIRRGLSRSSSARGILLLGCLLAFGVIAWEHVIHAYLLGHPDTLSGHLQHWFRDSLMALPMGLAAAALSLLWTRVLRLGNTTPDLLGRAALAALFFGVFLVPSAPIHNQIDAYIDPAHGLAAAQQAVQASQALSDEHYGHLDTSQANPGLVQLEQDSSVSGQALHGVHDALIGEAAALPLAVVGILVLSLGQLRRRRQLRIPLPRAPGLQRLGRHLALGGAALVVGFAFYGSGLASKATAQPVFAASDPCASASTPTKTFNVSAINAKITYNHFGDNDPGGFMYVLDQNITAVQNQASAGTVTTGLREDPIQPLVLRANLGDCVVINFTNRLTQGPLDQHGNPTPAPAASIHVHGVSYQIASAGSSVGFNPQSFAAPSGGTITYKLYLDPALGEGAKVFHSHGDSRELLAHGLFGAIIAEPAGATFLDPQTAQPLNGQSNWEAIIQMPSGSSTPSFREFAVIYHEVGDEQFNLSDASGKALPQNDSFTTAYRPGSRALNYRSEPFFDRLGTMNAVFNTFDESQGYGSYMFGDPATPTPRSYLGEPTKWRLIHAGSEQSHVHHLHGGGDRWRANPGADPSNDISGGLEKNPAQNAQSIRLDSQTLSPMESYTAEIECGAGGCQQAAGDFLYHCHIAMHYISGMWAFWRVFDTLQGDLAVIPGRASPPQAVNSSGLIGLTLPATGNKTIVPQSQLTDPTTQVSVESVVESQLPPPGTRIDSQDATVWDWQKQGTSTQPVYVGEAEDAHCWANFCSANPVQGQGPTPPLNGNRPQILFNPSNARYTWPLFRPHLGQRPPFSPNGHDGAPWLGDTVNSTTRPDGLCPSGATVRTYNITAITLPIKETAAGDTDPNGQIFVLNEDKADVLAGNKPAIPLAIRSNVGDCVAITLSSQLVDFSENDNFSKVNMHTHFVQFDPQASDGVITGRSFEQSVRPFPTENRTLSAAASAGETQITVSSTSRLHNGITIAVGQGQPDIEIAKIASISGNTLTLAAPLVNSHSSGESAGVEFVQYRWYSDVDSGTVFWHDHVNGILSWGHGLFGAHIIEPPGSTYHDPKTGAVVRSGQIVDIWNTSGGSVGVGQSGSFREFMVWLHNDTRAQVGFNSQLPGCEQASINLRAEPFAERAPNNKVQNDQTGRVSNNLFSGQCPEIDSTNDPYIFSSVTHGDPVTPLWRAYVGDPVIVRTIGLVERVGALRIQGHRFRRERFNANGTLMDAATTGISERFDYVLDGGAGGPARMPGDYLYYSTRNFELESGAWGIFRVHNTLQGDLEALPGLTAPPSGAGFPQLTHTGNAPPAAANGGNPCPSTAPVRSYNVTTFNQKIPMDGNSDGNGQIYALSSDVSGIQNGTLPTIPLAIRANVGDCVKITLTNQLGSHPPTSSGTRAGLSLGLLPFDPQGSSGAAIGFNPDSSVPVGSSFTYVFWADRELGTAIFLNWGAESSVIHGAYGALIVEPSGSTYTAVKDNSTLSSGLLANIMSPGGKFREFVALFTDNDPQIGRSIMDYNTDVQRSVSALNYNAAPLDARLRVNSDPSLVFNSSVQGDPPTTLMRAYPGDPVRFRVAVPFSANIHTLEVEGHSWPWEPLMTGSQVLDGRTITSGETIDAQLVGGAGGTEKVAGDYLYGDHRMPFQRAGLWGIFRVYGATQPDLVTL